MDAKSIADTTSEGLLDDVWDAADLQVRNLDRALFAVCVEYSYDLLWNIHFYRGGMAPSTVISTLGRPKKN